VLDGGGGACHRWPDARRGVVANLLCDRRHQRGEHRAGFENELNVRASSWADDHRIDEDEITVEIE
jgi:hypothetical protein